jgi:hypothetical protein
MAETEETAIARPQLVKHVSAAMKQHATTEELLETMFSVWSVLSYWLHHTALSYKQGLKQLVNPCRSLPPTIEKLTHHDLCAQHEDHICRGAGKAD